MQNTFFNSLKITGLGVYALILCSIACSKKTFVPVDDNTPVEKEQAAKPKDETPTDPATPATPTDPTNPTNPTGPTTPTNPTGPTTPTNPAGPTTPTNPTNPATPTNPAGPTTPTNPTDPTNPAGPTTPTNPANPTGPTVPQNLTARLAINQGSVRDYEGGALSWTMTLDQRLDKPAQIKVNTNTNNYKANYANPEDFSPAEYSYDGYTWIASTNNVVEIPPQKTAIQVRIPLVRDGAPEILEEKLQVSFTHDNPGEVNLIGYVPVSSEATVIDRDVEQDKRTLIDKADDKPILLFEKDASGVYKLSAVPTSVTSDQEPFAIKQKQLIDGGYKEIIDFISPFIIKPIDAERIYLNLDPSPRAAGRVGPEQTRSGGPWTWALHLSLVYAFGRSNSPNGLPLLDHMNTYSYFGTALLHEIGHLYTLFNEDLGKRVKDIAECNGGFFVKLGDGSCYNDTTYASHFIPTFYDLNSDYTIKGAKAGSTFVNQYAATSIVEDIAECFQYYMRTPGVPAKDNNNPLSAQNKIAFFEEFPEARALKQRLRALYPNMEPVYLAPYNPQNQASAYRANIFAYESIGGHEGCVKTEHMSPFPKR